MFFRFRESRVEERARRKEESAEQEQAYQEYLKYKRPFWETREEMWDGLWTLFWVVAVCAFFGGGTFLACNQ